MFTKILVAVSASSVDTVLAAAIETARTYDARIVALHVVDPTPSHVGASDCHSGLIVEAMQEHGRKVSTHVRNVLDSYAHPAKVLMVTLPMSGMTIGGAIAAVADETDADLIVLGERSSSLWRWLSEDVASEVTRCSGRPTLIAANGIAARTARRTRCVDVSTARIGLESLECEARRGL